MTFRAIFAAVAAPLLLIGAAGCSDGAGETTSAASFDLSPSAENYPGRIRDAAQVLDPPSEARLTALLDGAEERYGQQVGIVTVQSLEGYAIEDYSLYYARRWGLGDAERNDGLMILLAPNERKVRIEVGKGIESTFTDLFCKNLIDEVMIPRFKEGDFEAGVEAGAQALVERMKRYPSQPANDNETIAGENAA